MKPSPFTSVQNGRKVHFAHRSRTGMRPKIIKNLGLLMFALLIRATANAQAPVAAFVPDDSIVCVGIDVAFTDMSTGIGPLTWSWDFGDAGTSTLQ